MLFNINKQKSAAFIKLFVTLAIVFIPAFLHLLSMEAAVNLMFVISSSVFLIHLKANGRVNISFNLIISLTMAAFGVISFIWVNNRSGQFTYLLAIIMVVLFGSIFKEYFSESIDNSFKRRISYLLSISGTICAFYNFIYWISVIVPVAGDFPFSKGFGKEDFFGIFMAVSLLCTLSLFKGNSKSRKVFFTFAVLLILFCLFMAKSIVSWLFLLAVSTLFFVNKKSDNKNSSKHLLKMLSVVLVYIVALLVALFNSESGKTFSEVFSYASNNLFGAGGGFLSAGKTFSESSELQTSGVGILPFLFASSGILGIIFCFLFAARSVLLFVRNKSFENAVGIITTVSLLFLPFGNCITTILLVIGINAYNEYTTHSASVLELDAKKLKNTITAGVIVIILISAATVLSFVEMKASSEFEKKNYQSSYDLAKIVAAIDVFDSDCNMIAAASIRNDKNLLTLKTIEAVEYINEAIENDSDNIACYEEKAKLYFSCSDYENAAAQYRIIVSKTVAKDRYNLALTNVLFNIVEKNEKGSSETKRAYEEIVEIAQMTENLEIKEQIMDIADKALVYTKGELSSEGEIVVE